MTAYPQRGIELSFLDVLVHFGALIKDEHAMIDLLNGHADIPLCCPELEKGIGLGRYKKNEHNKDKTLTAPTLSRRAFPESCISLLRLVIYSFS